MDIFNRNRSAMEPHSDIVDEALVNLSANFMVLSLALLGYHLAVSSQSQVSWNFHTWNTEPILFLNDKVTAKMKKLLSEIKGQVDSTEFAESAESAENHNFISSLIKQPKEYP